MSPLSATDGGEGDHRREDVRMVTNREIWISVLWELVVNHPHYTLISMKITSPPVPGKIPCTEHVYVSYLLHL